MSLVEKINEDVKTAMKNQDKEKLNTIKVLSEDKNEIAIKESTEYDMADLEVNIEGTEDFALPLESDEVEIDESDMLIESLDDLDIDDIDLTSFDDDINLIDNEDVGLDLDVDGTL